ncbi:mechanosensitive ion channel [Rhodobacteraceae bacterium 2CG4]|uniref:Mechanosensitive ion channel n=1 Tax=Halovulum marinum TaxID=2662447 RepID=A0A6L5Z3N4_9RHOB|nr:mechanosensitive ion channel domain-containing protein [Halovulum marinum]MSU90622.1 mechanosensitive ion channel [Halovulum marinum]
MQEIYDWLRPWIVELTTFVQSFQNPWRFYQVLIVLALIAAGQLLSFVVRPRAEAWARAREGLRTWQLRIIVVVLRRTRLILVTVLLWTAYWIIREVTWPSRSYLIGIVATLALAWLLIGIATRLIRNPALRAVVRWGAWAWVTLEVLGLRADAEAALDGAAITLGETRVSLLLVLKAAVTMGLLIAGAGMLSRMAERRMARSEDLSPSLRVLAGKLLTIALFVLAVIMALNIIGFDLTSLTVLSGAIGLGLGFGLQKVVSNLVSGVIVLLDRSIKPGDVISLGDTFGWVTELNARFVAVITRDGREYLIPNEDLITTQVVNWTHSSNLVRLDIHFGVSYDSDPHAVRALAREAAATVRRVVASPAPVCHIVGFGDSSVDFILRFWIEDPAAGLTNVRGDVFLALWDALKRDGIEIPFPRRDVEIRNPQALPGAESPATG